MIPWNPESWFFSYAIPNQELLPKACLAASPTPHSPEKTAQRNLFHLRRKTGRYGAQASDGDNWDNDSPICRKLFDNEILPACQYFAYIEITSGEPQNLWREYEKLAGAHHNFAMQHIESPADIYPVFRELFKKTIEIGRASCRERV